MKRLLAFLALALVLDASVGAGLDRLYRRTLTGERGGLTNFALTRDADVLVLGSSRAQYHFMPSVLEAKLGLRSFNAGLKGHDFLYSVLLYDLWKRRHPAPRALVLQIDMESLLQREQELAAVQIFAPYLDESERVREVLYGAAPWKRFEYLSRVYRYNGKLFSILRNVFRTSDPGFDGFMRGAGTLDPAGDLGLARHGLLDVMRGGSEEMAISIAQQPFSPLKARYLRELLTEAAGTDTLVFLVHSPLFGQSHRAHAIWTARVRELIADQPDAEFIDICDETHPEFADPQLFLNFNHLNGAGAEIFSTVLAAEMDKRMATRRLAATSGARAIPAAASYPISGTRSR